MGENELQDACKGALQAYFLGKNKYVQFSPYSNQQSEDLNDTNLFVSDILGVLDDATLLLLEMKYYDVRAKALPEFRQAQFNKLLTLEQSGVPVAYCYNQVEDIAYFGPQTDPRWPAQTLNQLMRSVPSRLPNEVPNIPDHQTLLDWIRTVPKDSGGNVFTLFTRILDRTLRAGEVRNQALLLIFSHGLKQFISMDEQQMKEFARWIVDTPTATSSEVEEKAEKIRSGLSFTAKKKAMLVDLDGKVLTKKKTKPRI